MESVLKTEVYSKPLVSIVLPTYNRAHLLDGAIQSCLDQTWKSIELIVVDDGSSDNTEEIALAWAARDQRVCYVKQENGKIPRALNTGFKIANGSLLTWTSDDNYYEQNAIEIMAMALQQHDQVGLVYCNVTVVDENNNITEVSIRSSKSISVENCVGACFMYRRSIAEIVGEYDPQTFLAEDYDYWLRISKLAPIYHIPDVAPYRYRVHKQSHTNIRGAEAEIQAALVRVKYAGTKRERRIIMADGHRRAGTVLRTLGHHRAAFRHYIKSVRLNPYRAISWRGLVAVRELFPGCASQSTIQQELTKWV